MLEFSPREEEELEETSNLTLLSDPGVGEFPGGTRVFPSRYHLKKRIWILVASSAAFCVLCLTVLSVVGFSSSSGGKVSSTFLILFFLTLGLTYWVFKVWNRQDRQAYEEEVERGSWLEGVFVFSTGDVVIRFNSMFRKTEMEFDGGSISTAVGNDNERMLVINYTDVLTGIPRAYVLDCKDLVHAPSEIAQCINATGGRGFSSEYERV